MGGKSASIMIRILGDAEDATAAADKTESRFEGLGKKLGKVGLAVGAGLAAGAAGALVGLEKIGSTFDDAFDGIAVKTGATGDALAGLEDSFKNVFTSVPVSADDAATAIGGVTQKLGLTGKPLEDLSTQLLNLSRITDTDLGSNVEAVTDLFNQFGVAAGDQGPKLDELFTISQKSGVAVGDLASAMADGGVQFRAAGFSFEETAGLLGTLGKAGLETSDVLPALSKVMGEAAESGQDASVVLADLFEGVKNAPDDVTAANLAFDLLGAKAGPKFAAMIREGTLSLDDLTGGLDGGISSINDTAAATDDWREKLQLLMNKAMVKLEPLASKVFGGIGDLLETIIPKVEEFFEFFAGGFSGEFTNEGEGVLLFANQLGMRLRDFVDWVVVNWPKISEVIGNALDKVGQAISWVSTNVIPPLIQAIGAVVDWVALNWPQISQTIGEVMTTVRTVIQGAIDFVTVIWTNFGEQITTFIQGKFEAIRQVIDGALQIIRGIVQTVTALIHGDWSAAWEGIRMVFAGVVDVIVGVAKDFLNTIQTAISVALQIISGIWSAAWEGIKSLAAGAWEGIKSLVSAGVDAVVGFVTSIPARLAGVASSLFSAVESGISTAWDGIKTTVSGAVDEVVGFVAGIPGRLLELVGNMTSAGASIGGAIIDGIGNGITGAVGFFADLGSAAVSAMKSAANQVIDQINNALEFTINGPGPLPDIHLNPPDLPHFHSGGIVPGPIGVERLAVLQAGEGVFTRGQMAALGGGGGFPSSVVLMIGEEEFVAKVLIKRERRVAARARAGVR